MTLSIPARFMYDSTDAAAIPATAEMVAGYVDGVYRWSDADWARHPNAVKVRIATQPETDDGDGCDVERGDLTPAQAPAFIRRRQAAGIVQPFVYCAAANVAVVRSLCAGLLYWLWVADWTGEPHPVNYAAAVQYANDTTSGGHYDLSIVYSAQFPGPHVPVEGIMGYLLSGPAASAADQLARRIKIHEWAHQPGAQLPAGWPGEAGMDALLTQWVADGAEGVFQTLFGA